MFAPNGATALSGAFAAATVSLSIAGGFLLAHYAGRRARLATRDRERDFEAQLDACAAGKTSGRGLLAAAARLEPDSFWDVIGSRAFHVSPRAARARERILERSRHVRTERIALLEAPPMRRELAASRLGWIGARKHLLALRHAAVTGPEPVSLAALAALARVRDEAALRWLLAHPESLAHRSPRARLALLRAFGRRGTAHLLAAFERGIAEPRMERAVIEALALARHAGAAPRIAQRLTHEWRDVRVAAARALGMLNAVDERRALAAALDDADWRVRAQAARSLGRLGATEVIEALRRALRDPSWWVRRHAAYALAALGEGGMTALREVRAGDADPYARDIAAEALGGGFPGTSR